MASRRSSVRGTPARSPLLIGLLIAAACGSNTDTDTRSDTERSVATTQETRGSPAAAVPEALRFRAPRVGGGEIDMSTLAGKPVVMWFWAPY
jgi:hypothetical protein